jgi:hypothetical protein
MQQVIITLLTSFWLMLAHPFFISLTEMRYNPNTKKMEIAQKIFWDDLEVALAKDFKESVDFLNPKDKTKLNNQIKTYLLKHNQVWVNGKPLSLTYLGYEVDEEAAWIYMESSPAELPKTVEVRNTILVEEFSGQQNIIHVYFQSKSPRSMLLGKGEEKGKVAF